MNVVDGGVKCFNFNHTSLLQTYAQTRTHARTCAGAHLHTHVRACTHAHISNPRFTAGGTGHRIVMKTYHLSAFFVEHMSGFEHAVEKVGVGLWCLGVYLTANPPWLLRTIDQTIARIQHSKDETHTFVTEVLHSTADFWPWGMLGIPFGLGHS